MNILALDEAWRAHHHTVDVSRREFDAHLAGCPRAYLLHLDRVRTLKEPVPLHRLRQEGPFHPPQRFRYVAESDPALLRGVVPDAADLWETEGRPDVPIR